MATEPPYRGRHYAGAHYSPATSPWHRLARPRLLAAAAAVIAVVGAAAVATGSAEQPVAPGAESAVPAAAAPGEVDRPPVAPEEGTAAAGGPGPGAVPAQEAAPAPAPVPLETAFLAPPPEYQPLPDAPGATGPLPVEQAAAVDGPGGLPPEEFTALGFRGAHARQWRGPLGRLHVVVYDFADPGGAAEFVARTGAPGTVRADAVPLRLPSAPEAPAYHLSVAGEPLQVALTSRGARASVVGLHGPGAADPTGAGLGALVAAQTDALD